VLGLGCSEISEHETMSVTHRCSRAGIADESYRLFKWFPRWGLQLHERRALLVAGDFLAVSAAAILAIWIWSINAELVLSPLSWKVRQLWAFVFVASWVCLNFNQYDFRIAASRTATLKRLLSVAGAALVIYLCIFFLSPRGLLPRLAVIHFVAAAFAFSLIWRLTYISVFISPHFQRRILVVGTDWAARMIVSAVTRLPERQYVVAGFIDDDSSKHGQVIDGVKVLGGCDSLSAISERYQVSEIVLALTGEMRGEAFKALLQAIAQGISVVRMPSLFEQLTGRVPIEHLDAEWMVASFMDRIRPSAWFRLSKRVFDLVGATLGLICAAMLVPIIALVIALERRGSILYRQSRLGKEGRPFNIIKFRTMVPDAEREGQPQWACADDIRITGFGRFLRRARFDELPQLWNVLKGEMSLVGPRPERPEFVARLEKQIPFYRARLISKPGITGWAQVNYGYGASVEDAAIKLEYDLYYIKHQSVWLDLRILAKTLDVVVRFRGI